MKKYLFVCFVGLLFSTKVQAEELILPKNNIKIELPSNCKLTADNALKTVACTDPILDARYEENSFDTLAKFFQKVQREGKSLLEKDGNIKVHTISEYDITPYDENGEFHHFMIFMDVKGIRFIQHYTLISLDKQMAFYVIQTHNIAQIDTTRPLLQKLTTIKGL